MKIAITANTSWYLYNFRKNTILELIKQNHEVYAIAPLDEYSSRLMKLGCKFSDIKIDRSGKNLYKDFKTFFDFYRIFRRENISIVLNFTPKNNIYSTLAAWLNRIKIVNNIAGLGVIFTKNNFFSKLVSLLYKISQSKADFIFFQNEEDRNLFLNLKIIDINKSDRLPGSGVDLSRFQVSPKNKSTELKFILVARLIAEKGIYHYIEAAKLILKKYNYVEFYLLGPLDLNNPSGISNADIKEWERINVVKYLGFSDCVEHDIKDMDCVVLPSYYREGVPKSLLEAAAMGKPIITTDNIGCREVVDDTINGFLCEMRSTKSLFDCIEKFIELPDDKRAEMGMQSRVKIMNSFDEKIIIEKYIDVINKI